MSINLHSQALSEAKLLKRCLSDTRGFNLSCWLFSTTRPDGYATFGTGAAFDGELYVHRIVARRVYGPIPKGHEVDHLCRTRNCGNPLHLAIRPLSENRPGGPKRDFCPKEHPYAGANLYVNPKTGKRSCRECMRVANRAADAKRRARGPQV